MSKSEDKLKAVAHIKELVSQLDTIHLRKLAEYGDKILLQQESKLTLSDDERWLDKGYRKGRGQDEGYWVI